MGSEDVLSDGEEGRASEELEENNDGGRSGDFVQW